MKQPVSDRRGRVVVSMGVILFADRSTGGTPPARPRRFQFHVHAPGSSLLFPVDEAQSRTPPSPMSRRSCSCTALRRDTSSWNSVVGAEAAAAGRTMPSGPRARHGVSGPRTRFDERLALAGTTAAVLRFLISRPRLVVQSSWPSQAPYMTHDVPRARAHREEVDGRSDGSDSSPRRCSICTPGMSQAPGRSWAWRRWRDRAASASRPDLPGAEAVPGERGRGRNLASRPEHIWVRGRACLLVSHPPRRRLSQQ